MMTNQQLSNRENFFRNIKGESFERVPYYLTMCDQLKDKLKISKEVEDYETYFDLPFRSAGIKPTVHPVDYSGYYVGKDVDYIGEWGDGHKYGSVEHFTHFIPSMGDMETVEEIWQFPLPDVLEAYRWEGVKEEIAQLKAQDYVVISNIAMDIFEPAWYLRGLEQMLVDFYIDPELATACLDRIKNVKIKLAQKLAEVGVDVIIYGDDVATQKGMMLSPELWRTFLKPRLKEVIEAAKGVNPDVLCYYHSCGDITTIVPELIEVGVDILNPIQPECMNPVEIYHTYKDKVAFWGTIGTQSTMPFGTPEEVEQKTLEMLALCKESGRMVIAPTHLLEPEVPLENIETFVRTMKESITKDR